MKRKYFLAGIVVVFLLFLLFIVTPLNKVLFKVPLSQHIQDTSSVITDDFLGYTLNLPTGWFVDEKLHFTKFMYKAKNVTQNPPQSFMYISVIPKNISLPEGNIYHDKREDITTLLRSNEGDNVILTKEDYYEEYYRFLRKKSIFVSDEVAATFQNFNPFSMPNGTTETRLIMDLPSKYIVMGGYSGVDPADPFYISPDFTLQILSGLKLKPDKLAEVGTFNVMLCYPSEVLPAGEIVVKDLNHGSYYSFPTQENARNFVLKLYSGEYFLRFSAAPDKMNPESVISGYYTDVCPTGAESTCGEDNQRMNKRIIVESGTTLNDITPCDFYYKTETEPLF